MSISTSNMLRRFNKLNQGKDWKHQIKPFNFFCVGFQTVKENGKTNYSVFERSTNNHPSTVHQLRDWRRKTWISIFQNFKQNDYGFIDHPEYKYEGDTGLLKRTHVHANEVIHIGKEANNIEEQPLKKIDSQVFRDKQSICEKILFNLSGLTQKRMAFVVAP